MAAIDKLGIINIIDKHFDALNGEYSPYVIEGNSTVFSFFKKLYDILKDGSIFENNLLLKTYEETIKEILVKLEQIENRKIYQYNFANSSDINDIKNSFTEMLKYLWKYVDRHFPQTLTENEQKVGYYNKNFGYHIEKEIEVEHTEESYEQISNEELQAGPQEGEEYYVHPIASTEVEYNPVTESEPQAGVEYYTNPVVSTREDYSLTQDSEPQPGAEYYVRSIIETIEIYNLAEESEPKADETYYTHPINEREVYTEESEPQQGEEYYVHPVSSIEENYSNVTEEEPQAGIEYYVHPTVLKDVFTKLLDKSSGIQPGVEYYKMNGTPTEVYTPLTTEEINNGPQEGEVYYIFDGGIWVEKPYASLEDGTDNNKIFSEGYVYNKKSYDYSGVEYVLCTDEDFDTIITNNGVSNERGLIPIDASTYSQPITRESISKIYVNPLPEEGIRYVDNTATITRIPATTFEEYEAQYGRPIYKLVDGEYVPIESGDMVKNEDNGAWYLDPQYTYFSKETRTLPYFRESTEDDFDYTGDFENASFKEGRNYRYLNGLEVASGYIERGEKYSTIELGTSDLRVVLYADFYTNSFYESGSFDESDRDVYYEVENEDGLRSRYLNETLFNKLYQSSDLVTYEKATTSNENIFKVLKNFEEWFRYNGSEYISSSTFLDHPKYITLSTLSVSGAYVFDNGSYRLVTEDDLYENKMYYKLDISKQYYFHELTFENNRYGQKLFKMTQDLLPTTTTETTFKDDMDYYIKSQVSEINTNEYVKNQSSGLSTLFNGLDADYSNVVKAIDIYTGEEAIYICKRLSETSIEMYKLSNLQSEPQLLFTYSFGNEDHDGGYGIYDFDNTNGKLFVFGGGLIIDYLKNDQNIWVPITINTPFSKDNEAIMVGNNVVLSRKIIEDGPNKNKYEIYYYDYSTRSLKKTNDIPLLTNVDLYGFYHNGGGRIAPASYYKQNNYNNDIYIETFDYRDNKEYTELYIFNKKFIKITGTLNEYTSTNKYSGISYPDTVNVGETLVEDWSNKEFGKLYIPNYPTNISFNRIISAISKTQDNYYGCTQFVFYVNGDTTETSRVSIQYHIDDTNNRFVYDCINEDTNIVCCYIEGEKIIFVSQKSKELILYKYDFETNRLIQFYRVSQDPYEEGINFDLNSLQNYNITNDIFVINNHRTINDNNIYFGTILKNPDYDNNEGDIPLRIGVNYETFDVSVENFTNKYRFPYIESLTNIMVCCDENDNVIRCYDYLTDFSKQLNDKPVLAAEHTDSDSYLLCVKEDDDRLRIYKSVDRTITPTDTYLDLEYNETNTFDIATINDDLDNFFLQKFSYDAENDVYTVDFITNKSSFEEGVDYFTKTVTKTYDNSSYVLAENLEEGIPYFTKTIVKEVVDDTSYVPAGDLQSFDDDIDYFTKTIAYTYDDSSYVPAGNLQSFDENTQYFNKIVTNIYDTSSYVPAENLQVFDDGASYFTKSITYTYDDSSYVPAGDLQSFDDDIDYFTKKITVVTETQTISTYESDDGTELKFNGYKEDIIIGGKLLPIYNENGKVEYDNDVYIKMLGVDKVYPEIIVRLSKNEEYKYYSLNDAILTIFKNDNYKKFSTNDVDSKNVLIEYSFDNGFVVNDNNEYESPNGLIYELFLSALRSIVDSSRNYFMEKLKKYFYDGIVSRYREKKIEDKRTSLVIRDDGLNSNDMMVVPKVYEKLGGKGGSIGSITTLDFDKKTNFDSSEYIRMVFDDAYYNTKTNNIELYFDLNYMNGFIKSLSNYRGIDGFINNYAMRFNKDANIRQWLLINKKEIEEAILKSLLFAIEPCFWPDYTSDESWNKNFYVNNAAKLQKVYYYNNKTYSKEDELLKDLNLSETNKKFVEYSVIRKQRNISIDFDNDKFIILLKNEDRLTIDKELFDENDSYFERNTISNEEYNEKVADYFKKLNLEKLYLGSGYINIRKVPQKFKDNGVSELVDCEYVNKNVFNESEEFSSILDDREFIILHNVNTKVSNGNNVFYDTENNYSDIEFPYELEGSVQTIPIWKSAKLYKKKHYFELVCSNFMKKNNIEAIKQIRVMQPTNNKNRYLFNVRSIENRTTEEKGILFDINFKDLEDYKISYVLNNTLHIPNQSVLSTGINEDTLRLSSLPDNEKFDYYSDSSLRITYDDEKFPSEEQYVFDDTMYIKSPSNIVEEEELLILAERSKEYKVFTSEYIMILEPGLETNKLNIADGEYINVQILDFLQVSPGAINVELPQLVYDNEGNGSVYVKTVEPEPLIFRGFYKKFELIDSSPSLLVERRNMVNFNINKQNLTIKKDLNKKITFKENLKFSKQMALRIFDESPKLELFENKWLKCKRLNGSLECKVSNMGELQLEKIERVYLEFPEFSDKNTILVVNFLPEEARLINSVIKLLPNNYTFRNDKNAVYIYDSNGNSVDTLYKNFYLDCDVLKQGEKIIEGKKFIDFEFKPSREYFNGTDRWIQLINNQPFVIPLIEGMDQELKKFEVIFH